MGDQYLYGETTVYLNPRWNDGIHYEKTTKTDGLGLIHMNARVYDPAMGRFLQADPIGFEGGIESFVFNRKASAFQ